MSRLYSYSGVAADQSSPIQKKTHTAQPVTVFVSGTSVVADAVSISIEDHTGAMALMENLKFGAGKHDFKLPVGVRFQVDVNNGGINPIVVDVYV